MAEEKKTIGRYFYLMLKENYFDTDDIVLLESMENGYLYSNILLKLYLKSLKDKGKLMYKDRIPYNIQMLAKLTRHNVDVVKSAIKIFEEMGIVEKLDNGAMFMLDIENYIGKSSTEADRRRKYDRRISEEKQILLDCEYSSDNSCEKSHEHIESDLNLNLDEGLIDINNIYSMLKKVELVQKQTDIYNEIFINKDIYIISDLSIPETMYLQIKLYQMVIKDLVDTNQIEALNQTNKIILEKVFGQVSKAEIKENLINYYKAALLNEIIKRSD